MKFNKLTVLGSIVLLNPLTAQDLTMSVQTLADPTSFSITAGSDLNLRVAEQVPSTAANASTHILIDGLSPIEEGSLVYASNYRGINAVDGAEQDLGILFLELPESSDLPDGTVSSPIVGVVQREGDWSGYSLNLPTTSVGGASGSSNADANVISATLVRGGETFTGNIPFTVIDTDTIELEPFTLVKDGATSINLSGAVMVRDGMRYYGTVTNLSDGAAYDSLLFALEFSNIPDADGDGIPDLTDDSVGGGMVLGEWARLDFGWVYGLTAEWGVTVYMSYVYMTSWPPYVYQVNTGWMYYIGGDGEQHVFYDWDLGWIFVNEGHGGWYYHFQSDVNSGSWANFADPQP